MLHIEKAVILIDYCNTVHIANDNNDNDKENGLNDMPSGREKRLNY